MERVSAVPAGAFGERVRRVLALIDAVHRAPPLPSVRITASTRTWGSDGWYRFDRAGRPREIVLNPESTALELAVVHEIGHVLDHQVLGRPGGFASRRDPALLAWRSAVGASAACAEIRRDRRDRELIGRAVDDCVYLLRFEEMWARSYAQYIAATSGDELIGRQVAAAQMQSVRHRPQQWTAEDFAPILAAIDDLLRRKGWR